MATPIPRNRACFSVPEVLAATTGELLSGSVDGSLRGVAIDSRAVEPGGLFVAIRGERLDGHDYLAEAVGRGAAAVVVSAANLEPEASLWAAAAETGVAIIAVRDTLAALGDLAAMHRRRWPGQVVAITGSAGKTTTKELVAAALTATKKIVHRTVGNLNNLIGVPMTLLQLETHHEVAVVELGTSRPGEIRRLAEITRADVGVVTLVAAAHTEGLGSIDDVAREKTALLAGLRTGARAVINGDDRALREFADEAGDDNDLWYFGRDASCHVQLVEQCITADLRTLCSFDIAGHGAVEARLMLLGEAAALNAAAALCVLLALGHDPHDALAALSAVEPTPGRMAPCVGADGGIVLDDTYNANPRSMAMALETAAAIAQVCDGSLVAVLGDMKELGARSAEEHLALLEHAVRIGADPVFACGSAMVMAASSMRTAAASATALLIDPATQTPIVTAFADASDAISALKSALVPRAIVLVKGSRSMAMERVVAAIVETAKLRIQGNDAEGWSS